MVAKIYLTVTETEGADAGVADLWAVMEKAVQQCTRGKGEERHGNGSQLYEQPWVAIAKSCGPGFLTGQAVKKLMEASSMRDKEGYTYINYERELLGAIVYTAFALMHERTQYADQ